MKMPDIKKLYEVLDPEELAIMTFELLVKGDNGGAQKIATAVPRYTYTSPDISYTGTINRLFDVAALWSIEYWRCYAKMMASMGMQTLAKVASDLERMDEIETLEDLWEGRLCALGLLLVSLKNSHDINSQAIMSFGGAETIYGLDTELQDLSEDAKEFYDNYRVYFESLIDGLDPPESVNDYFFVGVPH
jgi:hypothetical protein